MSSTNHICPRNGQILYGKLVLGDSRKLSIVFTIDNFSKSIDSFDGIIDSFYIKNARVNVPPPQKNFFSLFSQRMILSLKKLLYEELFETSFPKRKVIFIFVIRRPFPFKKDFAPRKSFSPFFPKVRFFFFFFFWITIKIIKYSVRNL